jgi:ABC-type branched-subunit amino acid transport system substrate-binding protein
VKQRIEIGVLYSRSGNYALVSEACRTGALKAIAAVNADPRGSLELVPVERDPGGNIDGYAQGCEDILRNTSARHVIGCVTSWSRKEVIPVLEKAGGTLWYGCPYEGFEANEHVVYMHACPNQHLVPLLGYVVPRFGADGFLLGSNYIWGWETNRVARDLIADAGGQVLGERYLPLGETDVSRLIAEIEATRPNFILNNLIGSSSYAFLATYAVLAARDPRFSPERCPVLFCNLTECELPAIADAASGHLSVGPYFRGEVSGAAAEVAAYDAAPGSSLEAAADAAVRVLAEILAHKPEARWTDLPSAFSGRAFSTPLGRVAIDPQTQHATLPVQIGRIEGRGFTTVSLRKAVAPDPYLSRYNPTEVFGRPRLKVVS